MTHYTRHDIVVAVLRHTSLALTLGAGDTAWRGDGRPSASGPGLLTYRVDARAAGNPLYVAGEDYPDGDPDSDDYRAAVAALRAEAEVSIP